ncbi:MFS transporter [Patescibacteria group bacterium]|nr:MFS transporter [Patescibacteria group bacterium]
MHLFLSGVARRVAVVLLSLFSSIYIFQIARDLGFAPALAIIFLLLYFLLGLFTKLVSLVISENLSQRIGFKGTIWVSAIPFAVFLPSIIFAASKPYLFLLAAVSWGFHAGLFWWGYHGYFIKTGERHHFGQGVGEANLLETLAVALTPIVGAFIASYLGFTAVFIASSLFMFASLILLGKDHDKRQRRDVRFVDVLKLIKTHKSISLAYIGAGAETYIYFVAWPLFLFLLFGQVITLGLIVSLSTLFAAVFAVIVGRWVDRQGERKVVAVGAPLLSIAWIIRFVTKSLPAFVLADSIWNFGQRMLILPLNVLTYKKGLETGVGRAILFRETSLIIGGVVALLTLIVVIYLGGDLSGGFVVAAIFSTLPLVSVIKHRIHDADEKEE